MTELRYLAPNSLDEAISAFAAAGSAGRVLAGGTDLLVQMRAGVVKPGVIVDIKKIAEMMAIEETADGGFRVGAAGFRKCADRFIKRSRRQISEFRHVLSAISLFPARPIWTTAL